MAAISQMQPLPRYEAKITSSARAESGAAYQRPESAGPSGTTAGSSSGLLCVESVLQRSDTFGQDNEYLNHSFSAAAMAGNHQ